MGVTLNKKQKNTLRVGDEVKIIRPERVKRVGYPLGLDDIILYHITAEEKKAIWELLGEKDTPSERALLYDKNPQLSRSFDRILHEIGYHRLKKMRFGGKERKVHTVLVPELMNKTGIIINRRTVKSGNYYPPHNGYDSYTGEFDWEPGGLSNEKCHILFEIALVGELTPSFLDKSKYSEGYWFESTNLEKQNT